MRKDHLAFIWQKELRPVLATAFLVFLLVEWGSHAAIHIGSRMVDEPSISANQGTREDPCHSFVHCDDDLHRGRQVPTAGHDLIPNALIDLRQQIDPPIEVQTNLLIPFVGARGISRPPDPAVRPPEFLQA